MIRGISTAMTSIYACSDGCSNPVFTLVWFCKPAPIQAPSAQMMSTLMTSKNFEFLNPFHGVCLNAYSCKLCGGKCKFLAVLATRDFSILEYDPKALKLDDKLLELYESWLAKHRKDYSQEANACKNVVGLMWIGITGRGGSVVNKFRMSKASRSACVGDMVMVTVKKGKPDLCKKVMPVVIVRQRKPWRQKDGVYMYFEDCGLRTARSRSLDPVSWCQFLMCMEHQTCEVDVRPLLPN
eukprot:Gb_38832 [translate_table: standard]